MWQFRCRNRNRNRYSVSLYIYYNSILCLYILIPADLFTRWGIDLFSPPGSVLPVFSVRGSIYWFPQDRFRGDRIPRDTGTPSYATGMCVCLCRYVCLCVFICLCIGMSVYLCISVCVFMYMYVCMYICMYVYVCMFA